MLGLLKGMHLVGLFLWFGVFPINSYMMFALLGFPPSRARENPSHPAGFSLLKHAFPRLELQSRIGFTCMVLSGIARVVYLGIPWRRLPWLQAKLCLVFLVAIWEIFLVWQVWRIDSRMKAVSSPPLPEPVLELLRPLPVLGLMALTLIFSIFAIGVRGFYPR